jgi:NACHT domain-containing protein
VVRWVRVAGLLIFVGGLVWLVYVLETQGLARANQWTPILSLGVTITGAVITLVIPWLSQRPAAGELTGVELLGRAAEVLQAAVREQWRNEVEVRSLGDPDPMPVRWRLSDSALMDHDEHIASTSLRFAGRSDRIPALTNQFRRLRRRRLVIIGGPGSGKTTLAVQLLLQLLEGWQSGEPVPVLFSLASWDPHTQPRVQDWLATQLNQTYPALRALGPDTAQRLADQGRLLPVLDGLDEIPSERRGEVVGSLNASLHPDTGAIVTSRTAEYTETVHTGDVLTAAAVIEAQPLTASEAATYLEGLLPRQVGDSWQAVLTALRGGTAGTLAEVVSSPLGLWLLRVVHIEGRSDPQPLIDPGHYSDPTAIRHHLFQELIPAAVRSRPPRPGGQDPLRPTRHHDPNQVRRWLTTLATELRDANTRDWRWWQLARHTLTRGQIGLGLGLGFGLLLGLLVRLVVELRNGLRLGLGIELLKELGYGLLKGLGYGLVVGLVGWLVFALVGRDCDAPAHADFRLRGRATTLGSELVGGLRHGLVIGLVIGLLGGLIAGLVSALTVILAGESGLVGGLAGVLAFALAPALMIGLPLGLALGLGSFAASPSIARRASSPTKSQRGDRGLTVLVTSTFGLVGGLSLMLVWALVSWLSVSLGWLGEGAVNGLVSVGALVIGLMFGLVLGPVMAKTCWPTFVVASLWLAARRELPLRLTGFLDDAYRLGMLRIVGPVYQFRHATLQDHLAPPRASLETSAANQLAPPQ